MACMKVSGFHIHSQPSHKRIWQAAPLSSVIGGMGNYSVLQMSDIPALCSRRPGFHR